MNYVQVLAVALENFEGKPLQMAAFFFRYKKTEH